MQLYLKSCKKGGYMSQIPSQPNPDHFDIIVPRSTQWQPSVAASFMKALYDRVEQNPIMLSIRANNEGVSWVVDQPEAQTFTRETLESFVNQFYPGAQVTVRQFSPEIFPFYSRYIMFSRQMKAFYDLFTPVTAHTRVDPLQLVVQTMNRLQPGEYLGFSVNLVNARHTTEKEIEEFLKISAYDAGNRMNVTPSGGSGWVGLLSGIAIKTVGEWRGNEKLKKELVLRFDERKTQEYLSKLKQKTAVVFAYVFFDTPDKNRLDFLTSVAGAVKDLTPHGDARLGDGVVKDAHIRNEQENAQHSPLIFLQTWAQSPLENTSVHYAFAMTAEEAACLWHLPHSGFEGLKVNWPASAPAQVLFSGRAGEIPIGVLPNNNTAIALNRADRKYHTYVTGQTGTGKSTLLHNLIHHDIITGQGVGVIDPHGSLIKNVLKTGIPADRLDDVVYLRCADAQYPVPLNPFRSPPEVKEVAVFNTVLWILKSIYKDSWSATRMETVIRNILQVVLADPQSTPLDIQELVSNSNYRRRVIKALDDKLSRSSKNFWRSFEDSSPSEQKAQTQSVLSRLSAFLGSPHIELLTCHPNTLDFRTLISEGKIVLVDLYGDEVASEVSTLGAIFFAQFFLASLSLGEHPGGDLPRFYLYVDETQRFITSGLPDMFSEARKFGLSLTLANQYIGQLDEDTREGIVNNVGTKFSFECSPDEARVTAKLFEPHVTQQEMSRLGVGRAAVRTRWQGETLDSFIAQMFRAPQPRQCHIRKL